MTTHWTKADLKDYVKRNPQFVTEELRKLMALLPDKLKYGNEPFWHEGIYWHSAGEFTRWSELRILQRAKIVSGLIRQVPFILIPQQGKQRETKIVVDFVYWDCEHDIRIAEDYKGFRTATFIMKKKLFLHLYGHQYTFVESGRHGKRRE